MIKVTHKVLLKVIHSMDFVKMNISAGLIIIIMILMRKFAIKKLNYSIILSVWLLAVFRLIIPFDKMSDLSIYNIYYKIKFAFFNSVSEIDYSIINNIFIYIWLIGFILSSIYFLIVFYNSHRKIKSAVLFDSDYIYDFIKKQNLKRNVAVKVSNEISSPVSFGIIKPVILFPFDYDFDNREQLSHILLHEILHIKCFHSIIELLFSFLICVFWFNPFVWFLRFFIEKDLEILCDKKAIALLGSKKKYADSLVNYAQKLNFNESNNLYNHFIKNSLEERMYAIMNLKKASVFSTVVSLAFVGSVFTVFATTDNYIDGDEIYVESEIISVEPQGGFVPEINFSDEIPEIELDYSDIEYYITENKTNRAAYSINITNYRYESYGSIPPSIKVSTNKDGYTYTGTLTLGTYTVDGNRYIGYYSGTLYR